MAKGERCGTCRRAHTGRVNDIPFRPSCADHRWDLSERSDNRCQCEPGVWLDRGCAVFLRTPAVETTKFQFAGQRALCSNATPAWGPPGFGGIQSADCCLVSAFDPRVKHGWWKQYFTGGRAAWMAAEWRSSLFQRGGEAHASPGLASLCDRRLQGGRQRTSLNIAPVPSLRQSESGESGALPTARDKRR